MTVSFLLQVFEILFVYILPYSTSTIFYVSCTRIIVYFCREDTVQLPARQ